MVEPLAKLGAYGFPGTLPMSEKNGSARCSGVYSDRLLIETDAPDQTLPENRVTHPLGQGLNHPANIAAVLRAAAEALAKARVTSRTVEKIFGFGE